MLSNKIIKKKLLFVEPNEELLHEMGRMLRPLYQIIPCKSLKNAVQRMKNYADYATIISNANLHPKDHSLINGLSLVRMSQTATPPVPIILYTDDVNPIVKIEAQNYGTFKLLDQSKPEFKKNLIEAVNYSIKIQNWKLTQFYDLQNNDQIRTAFKEIPKLKPISWNYAEENLYNSFFESRSSDPYDPYRYANSWAYICQAARNNGHKFFDGSCLITIATENDPVKNDVQFVIINPLGRGAVKKTLDIAGKLKTISGNPVIIKKISSEQEEYFLLSSRCRILPKPLSKRLVDQYDDIHPQVVVNLKAFINNLTLSKKSINNKWKEKNFNRNLKKFSRENYTIKTTAPELFEDFLEVVLKWKRSFMKRYTLHGEFTDIPEDDRYYIDPYFPIFDYFSKNIDNRNTISSLIYVDNIPVGFSFLSRVSKICVGMYANIGDTNYEGLAEFMLYQNLTKAYWAGYKYVNLGGTESRYLYDFYRKLKLEAPNAESFEIKSDYLVYH